jgi:hypothetical protein
MAVIGVRYDEPNVDKYECVRINYNGLEDEKIFNSGDFVKDWYDCIKFMVHEVNDGEPVMYSSSVDNFMMDGAKFDSARLVEVDGKFDLAYEYSEAIEFFVKEGTKPSWDELHAICCIRMH